MVDNFVPNTVQVFGAIMRLNWEAISSLISSWVFRVHSGGRVEWLMQISNVVHQKSDGSGQIGFLGVAWLSILLNLLSIVVLLILVEPVDDTLDGLRAIMWWEIEFWEISQASTLIEVWSILEVP